MWAGRALGLTGRGTPKDTARKAKIQTRSNSGRSRPHCQPKGTGTESVAQGLAPALMLTCSMALELGSLVLILPL